MHGKNHERKSRIAHKSEIGQETKLILSHNNKKAPARAPALLSRVRRPPRATASGPAARPIETRPAPLRAHPRARSSLITKTPVVRLRTRTEPWHACSQPGRPRPPRASSPADSSVLHGEDLLLPRGHQPANLILVLLYCLLYVVLVVLDQILANGLLHLLDLVQRALADVAQRHLAVLP